MANTYTQLYIHLIFAVKNRSCLLKEKYQPEIFKYISGIITNYENKSIIVNGTSNHIHILIGLNPAIALSDLVREIKKSSSTFITKNKYVDGNFYWQEGFGGFSYHRNLLDIVFNYILNQKEL